MGEERDKEKYPEYRDILNLRIFGIDFGALLKNWLGVGDLSVLQDPTQLEAIKKRIEEQRTKLRDAQEQLRRKFGDAIRFDYDIRVRSLAGGEDEIRVGGGRFFDRLDELARERAQGRQRVRAVEKPVPYRKREGVVKPFTEIIEDENHVEVIAELPGVEEKDIELKIQQDKVLISTPGPERLYRAELELPAKVLEEPIQKSYHNGVLKIRLKKSAGP